MKWSTIIYTVLLIVLSFFTVLYFVKPRKIEVIVEKPVWDHIPDEVLVRFAPVPPDTTWKVEMAELIERIGELESDVEELPAKIGPDTTFVPSEVSPTELIVSQKTFREVLLGTEGRSLVDVESVVKAYGFMPAKYFENNLSITPHKENLIKEYFEKIPKPKSKFWTGVGIGAGTLGGLILVGFLTGAF